MAFYMTVDEIIDSKDWFLNAATVGHILHVAPQSLRTVCRENPQMVQFPFCYVGTHLMIPRIPFLKWIGVEDIKRKDTDNGKDHET